MNQLIVIALVAGSFLIGLSILNSYKDEKLKSKNDYCSSCGKKLFKDKDNTILFDGVICSECTDIALQTNALTKQAKAMGKKGFKFTKSDLVKNEIEIYVNSHKGKMIKDENKESNS